MANTFKISVVLGAVNNMSKVVDGAVGHAKSALQSLGSYGDLGSILSSAGIIAGLHSVIGAAEDSEVAGKRLNQVFRQMGDDSGVAAMQAAEYASKLQMQIGVEDELIMLTQAKLATFKDVSSETARMAGVFDRATSAAHDLEAAGFGDAASNAVQLGKALQDPIKGINALKRSGVTFTKAEQDKIKALVASNQLLEAQKTILNAVEGQVGGVAAATATDSAKMAVAWSEVQEQLGMALLPVVKEFADFFINDLMPGIREFVSEHPGVVKAIAAIGAGFVALTAISAILNAVLMMNPILLIAAAIAAAVTAIVLNWEGISDFFTGLWDDISQGFNDFIDWFVEMWETYTPAGLIYSHWEDIVGWFKKLLNQLIQPFKNFYNWLQRLWSDIVGMFNDFVDDVFAIPGRLFEAGENIVNSVWDGAKSAWGDFEQWWSDGWHRFREYLPFSPAKRGPLRDIHRIKLIETIAASVKPGPIIDAISGVTSQVRSAAPSLTAAAIAPPVPSTPLAKPVPATDLGRTTPAQGQTQGASINANFNFTINVAGNMTQDAKDDLLRQLRAVAPDLARMLQNEIQGQSRTRFGGDSEL